MRRGMGGLTGSSEEECEEGVLRRVGGRSGVLMRLIGESTGRPIFSQAEAEK